ncbi:hypothetical protein SNE40_009425 [Patella caerulea]|uniref:Uncharacterized protein n=1 Tax=Patella caerulea TaxID=87958 RepID=A0AAN8PRT5_PATCE
MLRLILVTMLVVITDAQLQTCRRVEPPADIYELNYVARTRSAAPITSATVQRLLAPPPSAPREKRAVSTSAELARAELKDATGSIILAQPNFTVSIAREPRCLCPHRNELLTRFKYGNGVCYVLFPLWHNKYFTRCLYRNCLTGCVSTTNGRRNLCRPKSYSYVTVWAICVTTKTVEFKKVSVRVPKGGCDCKSYPPSCFLTNPLRG